MNENTYLTVLGQLTNLQKLYIRELNQIDNYLKIYLIYKYTSIGTDNSFTTIKYSWIK